MMYDTFDTFDIYDTSGVMPCVVVQWMIRIYHWYDDTTMAYDCDM